MKIKKNANIIINWIYAKKDDKMRELENQLIGKNVVVIKSDSYKIVAKLLSINESFITVEYGDGKNVILPLSAIDRIEEADKR